MMYKRLSVYVIPHCNQRLNNGDVADYEAIDKHNAVIRVSDLKNNDMNFLIALHEFIELHLITKAGIKIEDIDKWDCEHPDEMGDHPNAPYRDAHKFSTMIEMIVANKLNVDWDEYEDKITEISNGLERLK